MTNIVFCSAAEPDPYGTRFAGPIIETYERFKAVKLSRFEVGTDWFCGYAPRATGAGGDGFYSLPNGGLVTWAGTWIHPDANPDDLVGWLSNAWEQKGSVGLAKELTGQFALFRIAAEGAPLEVITDVCGSLHVFIRKDERGLAVSTSSAALANERRLNLLGVQEFVFTGNVYGDRTLWAGVHKLPPASVIVVDARSEISSKRYWNLPDLTLRGIGLAVSVERLYAALTSEIRAISRLYPRILADLTGGYDSRLLLGGLLAADANISTTVSGSDRDPDAVVAALLASRLHLSHTRVPPGTPPSFAEFVAAVRLTDAEADAFDYAQVARIHGGTAARFSLSVGGSFGEIARGYWWELLWPKIGRRKPIDPWQLARARFAGDNIDSSVFSRDVKLDFVEHMRDVIANEVEDKQHLPNTAQMDWVYFTLRMQRWQGRMASSTSQVRPCLSPLSAAPILEAMLEAAPRARLRSLLVRKLFARYQSVLAEIPLEHGYPPVPFRWTKPWRHVPLIKYYAGRISSKLSRTLQVRMSRGSIVGTRLSDIKAFAEQFPAVFEPAGEAFTLGAELRKTGFFDERALETFLKVERGRSHSELLQWRRLITLEAALQILRTE